MPNRHRLLLVRHRPMLSPQRAHRRLRVHDQHSRPGSRDRHHDGTVRVQCVRDPDAMAGRGFGPRHRDTPCAVHFGTCVSRRRDAARSRRFGHGRWRGYWRWCYDGGVAGSGRRGVFCVVSEAEGARIKAGGGSVESPRITGAAGYA